MDDIARVIARMLDNMRARPTPPRSRPLQLYVSPRDSIQAIDTSVNQSENTTNSLRVKYDVAVYSSEASSISYYSVNKPIITLWPTYDNGVYDAVQYFDTLYI